MLGHIKHEVLIGPKTGDYTIGERVDYAIDKGLITRSESGNFKITPKGDDFLNGKVRWEEL